MSASRCPLPGRTRYSPTSNDEAGGKGAALPWATPFSDPIEGFFLQGNLMTEDTSRARDLLRIALELLQDDEALVAAAMISGAISVLDAGAGSGARSKADFRPLTLPRLAVRDYRSCA